MSLIFLTGGSYFTCESFLSPSEMSWRAITAEESKGRVGGSQPPDVMKIEPQVQVQVGTREQRFRRRDETTLTASSTGPLTGNMYMY